MKVWFVGAGPGDPELLTIKAQRLLRAAKVCIYAGSLIHPVILEETPAGCELHDSAEMTLAEIIAVCVTAHQRDVDVIRLHTGEPSIYGAIREQMNELDKLGIEYEVVPGISSFQASAAALKTELTAPEVSQTVILSRTSGRTPMPEKESLAALATTRSTLCLFLSVHKLDAVARELSEYYGDDCPVGVVYHVSWPDQRILRGTLADIAAQVEREGIRKTAMIVVGHALSREIPASKLYDPAFTHEYRMGQTA